MKWNYFMNFIVTLNSVKCLKFRNFKLKIKHDSILDVYLEETIRCLLLGIDPEILPKQKTLTVYFVISLR